MRPSIPQPITTLLHLCWNPRDSSFQSRWPSATYFSPHRPWRAKRQSCRQHRSLPEKTRIPCSSHLWSYMRREWSMKMACLSLTDTISISRAPKIPECRPAWLRVRGRKSVRYRRARRGMRRRSRASSSLNIANYRLSCQKSRRGR